MTDPQSFYDALAADYHLMFADWDASRRWQGEVLTGLLPGGEHLRILDAACGMGTQALTLAERGHEVTARDLSPALVVRLEQEAVRLGVECRCAVGDMRESRAEDAGQFDVVLAFDNGLAHLLGEEDLRAAFAAARAALRPGGVYLASLRDYDALLVEKPGFDPPRVLGAGQDERVVLQKWSWGPGQEYEMEHIVLARGEAGGWDVRSRTVRCRAHRREDVARCVETAGFAEVEWLSPEASGFYQWVLRAGVD